MAQAYFCKKEAALGQSSVDCNKIEVFIFRFAAKCFFFVEVEEKRDEHRNSLIKNIKV